jgi:hypothetical protein
VLVGVVVLGMTITMVRHGAFAPHIVVELLEDLRKGGRAAFTITACGQPATAKVRLGCPAGEQHRWSAQWPAHPTPIIRATSPLGNSPALGSPPQLGFRRIDLLKTPGVHSMRISD